MPPWLFVCPSSRGIGLEISRRLAKTGLPLVVTARQDLDKVKESVLSGAGDRVKEENVHVLKLDVCDESSIADAAAACSKLFPKKDPSGKASHMHLAFTTPGILYPERSPAQLDADNMLQTFRVNTIGPLLLMKHFSPFLPRKSATMTAIPPAAAEYLPEHATWVTLSARVGSITDNGLGGWYSYRASKAGVNQAIKTFDNHLRTSSGSNALAISMHPGTVKTGLSKEFWNNVKEGKLFEPDFAAGKLLDVVRNLSLKQRGRCWDWKGEEVPP